MGGSHEFGKIGEGDDIHMHHIDVNDNERFGLKLYMPEKLKIQKLAKPITGSVNMQFHLSTVEEEIVITKFFFFNVLLMAVAQETGDIRDRDMDRSLLYETINKGSGITLVTREGAYAALETDGHTLTEIRYEDYSVASVRLIANNAVLDAVDPELLLGSVWQDDDETEVNWDENFWR